MLSLNMQPPEKAAYRTDGKLDVVSIFKTIQGEGPFAGTPSVFVRLAGCNLFCPNCFHGNTQIRMADFSTKLISEIREGDKVLSYDEDRKEFVSRCVTKVMSREVRKIYRVDCGSPGDKTYVTGEHPFLVKGRGWVEVRDLRIGDKVLHLSMSELRRMCNPMKDRATVERMKATTKRRGIKINAWEKVSEERRTQWTERLRTRMINNNPMKDPEVAIKGYLGRKDRGRMTSAEEFVLAVGKRFGLSFIGGGDLVVGNKAPDFIIDGTNKLVEIWDASITDYLGRDKKWRNKRRKLYAKEGYEVLFLPVTPYPMHDRIGTRKISRLHDRTKEIRRIEHELSEYVRNGHVVKGLQVITPKTNPKAWVRLAGTLDSNLTVYNLEVEGTHTYLANSLIVHNCDTDYTTNRRLMLPVDIEHDVANHIRRSDIDLVVLTGGEPFRQSLAPLVQRLLACHLRVQIETNGTLYQDDLPYGNELMTIVCSPKTPTINQQLRPFINYYKYILDADHVDPSDGLPTQTMGMKTPVARPDNKWNVYVQPLDEKDPIKNKRHERAAVDSCLKHGYRLSYQIHKHLGLE